MCRRLSLIPVAVLLVVGWMVLSGFDHLTQSIFGSGGSASMSVEPYEILLRNAAWPSGRYSGARDKFTEWKLVVPRAYLVNEIGTNGAIYWPVQARSRTRTTGDALLDWLAGRHYQSYYPDLDTVLDSASSELKPAVFASEEERRQSFVGIGLGNRSSFPDVPVADYCVREDDANALLKSVGSNVTLYGCMAEMPRCNIKTILDGWTVDITVPRRLYNQPDNMCRIARAFLNKYTTKRDPYYPPSALDETNATPPSRTPASRQP
ncbi:hypothetical protein [Rhizobium tubonense]|uniref:Uncharacterized protein n=1 Tax=Rhizobium tubonense TaxID=484088 RepID=A0A2W4DMK3_9HYPH|nr:hypothetical protein [Rhizobium tubonense]PZM17214.1 hypothetical protein CPY51_03030 [Rhizobium tubonense]